MADKCKLGIIFGGRSGEHEVSLMSSRSVLSVLDKDKYQIAQIGIDREGRWWSGGNVIEKFEKGNTNGLFRVFLLPEPENTILYRWGDNNEKKDVLALTELDVIFPVLHGTFGEDGTIQGFFEMADIAYIGAGVLGSSLGMDKGAFKDVMRANGIPVVDCIVCTRKDAESNINDIIRQAEQLFPYPVFIKPANLGSSVGITKAKNRSDLVEGIVEAAQYDRRILIEKGISAREIEVSVLGNEHPRASVVGEIIPSDEFYSYKAKYIDGKSALYIPAQISEELSKQVQNFAIKAYEATDCAGMARVDFLLDNSTEKLYLNEINTIPGFTSISMYPKLWEASGLSYANLIDELIHLALERKMERNKSKRTYGE